jgi:ATP-dependent helicase/nuclease subunit B
MAVWLVIGRAGSGKTRRCFDGVAEALRADPLGPPVYWIVPKQATFMTERLLTCASGLGGFCRARVLSFDALGEEILEECGGAAVPEVTALGRQMILGQLLRKHQPRLRFFAQAARQAGLAAKLDATFAEFERNGRDSADLAALLEGLSSIVACTGEQQALFDKVHDLRLIYDAYTAYLGQERLDRHRRLSQVLSCMARSRKFAGARVFVDGFAAFTEYERRVLAQMGKVCGSVEIMLLMEPSSPLLADPHLLPRELGWFHSMEQMYRQLWFTFVEEGVSVEETVVLPHLYRFRSPALEVVEKQLQWRHSIERGAPEGLELIEAPDRRAEVDAVARRIRGLWREGVRLREVAVLVRDLEVYHELISASFGEHGIEYFVDRRRQVGHHPLLQFLRACLAIAQSDWPHDAVMTVLKSGLSGLPDDQADNLENYVLAHRIRGAAWTQEEPWTFARRMLAAEDETSPQAVRAREMDAARRALVGRLTPFIRRVSGSDLTLGPIVLAVFDLFERFGVQGRVVEWMKEAQAQNRLEQRDEHAQVWKHLVDLLDQMVALMGEEAATLADFVEIYEAGLERFELALTPPTTDEVLVGQVDRTRCPDVRVAFILGMNEGVFPKMPGEDSVLSDAERRALAANQLQIDPDTHRRLLDENLLAYIALTRPSERLIVSRSLTDAAGKSLGPSQHWRRLCDLFPKLKPIRVDNSSGLDTIGTPRQLIVALMSWVRGLDDERRLEEDSTLAALYQWLATHPPADDAIDVMRFRAWRALSYGNSASLSKSIATKLFGSPLHASVTRIEAFAACPFKHFARFGLSLREREDEESVNAIDLGNVYHNVLERIVGAMVAEKKKWQDVPTERRKAMIHDVAQEIGRQLRGEILLSSARNRYLLARIEQTLQEVTAAQEAAARRGTFSPAFAELSFGGESGALPGLEITTRSKRTIVLEGRIDRVDVLADQAAFAVIDYKLRGSQLSLERVYHGLSLQLLTYLLVLRENGQKLTGKKLTPAAAFYVKLLRQLEDVAHPDDVSVDDPSLLDLRVKPRGIFEGSYLKSIDADCRGGASEVVQAFVKNDGEFGKKGTTDVADAREFAALIEHAGARIGQLADLLLDGHIELHPFQIRGVSPCPNCEFRPLCRFDASINRYHHLEPMKREAVLRQVVEEAANK